MVYTIKQTVTVGHAVHAAPHRVVLRVGGHRHSHSHSDKVTTGFCGRWRWGRGRYLRMMTATWSQTRSVGGKRQSVRPNSGSNTLTIPGDANP